MELTAKQYEAAVNNAAEISQVLLDMEGGRYILAVFDELLQDLMGEGNTSGAALVVRKLHEITEVPFEQDELNKDSNAVWLDLFSETIADILDKGIL